MSSPPPKDAPSIAVLGLGRAGRDLVHLARASGVRVALAWNRSPCDALPAGVGAQCGALPRIDASMAVLAVSDAAIAPLARELAEASLVGRDTVLAHLSGATPSAALVGAGGGHGQVAMHPLQTFLGDGAVPTPFPWVLEGDERGVEVARSLVEALGCRATRISAGGKARYHAAATMASNLLVGLICVVERQSAAAGLSPAELPQLFLPLMETTLAHVAAEGTSRALTGPIRRGDLDTVEAHLRTLDDSPEDLDVYARLSLQLIDAALEAGLDEEAAQQLRSRLTGACCPRGEGG